MKLTKDQALHCAEVFSNYFDRFQRIDDYIRDQKLNSLSSRPVTLPGMGPEEDLFSDFTMHPNDMNLELIELPQDTWDIYLNMISSHSNMTSIPGRCFRLAVLERNTKKWVGFIRLGSPVINMKPRHELLGGTFTQSKEIAAAFNRTSIMGFVIVPSQPFGFNYLGGKLLAAICCSHWVRDQLNKKYEMNTCLFETTSLYGTSKSSSQYDGMKPYLRFNGLTESEFIPMMHGKAYENLKDYVENIIGEIVPMKTENEIPTASRKLKISNRIISLTKEGLKDHKSEYDSFINTITKAKNLTERKRYYYCDYGFQNFKDVVLGKTEKLIPNKENYDKFHLENIYKWWKNKATNRYESLKNDNRIRNDIEVWTLNKDLEIIR